MQSLLVAVILAAVVAGMLVPYLRRDLRASRNSFAGPKPESAFTRLLKKMKDKRNND